MVQINPLFPGYCESTKINSEITKRRVASIVKFTRNIQTPIVDIGGESDIKVQLSTSLKPGSLIFSIDSTDFNFYRFPNHMEYGTVLCFEILEHLQNPLFFLKQIESILRDDGSLYLSTPHRPKFLWPTYHYNEISATHMQKWLLTPIGLKIVRRKKLYVIKGWTDYLIGFRPLIRAFRTMNFRPIIASITNTTWIYEIKKDSAK